MRQGMMLLFCAAVAACGSSSNPGNQYKATLNFANEVPTPTVISNGTGTCAFTDNSTSMSYTLTQSGLTSNVTLSHIHSGSATQKGPVIVTLTPPTSGTSNGSFSGPDAGAKDINNNPLATYADVLNLIKSGNTYCNVHTSSNPGGEIRGQLVLAQ